MAISDDDLLLELDRKFKEYIKMLHEQKELSRELILANKKLVESEALKTHFISSITNEIINPFAAVMGLSRNILLAKKEDWEKVRNMARLIHSEAFNLDFQFRNIFAAAHIEAGEIFVESASTDLYILIDQVVESFRHEAEKRNICITVRKNLDNERFITDNEKLKLIFSNLLSNSIKFNSENGEIAIALESSGKDFIISIQDTGIGINEQQRENIFDRFMKGDDQINSLNTGHGLGLSVVKSLTELLAGTIQLSNVPGGGCRLVVTIPESENNCSIYNFPDGGDLNENSNNGIF